MQITVVALMCHTLGSIPQPVCREEIVAASSASPETTSSRGRSDASQPSATVRSLGRLRSSAANKKQENARRNASLNM